MLNRRRFIKILSVAGLATLGGYGIYRYVGPLPTNPKSRADFEKGDIKLVDNWILSAEEAGNLE